MQPTSHSHHPPTNCDDWHNGHWYWYLRAEGPKQAILHKWCQKFVSKRGRYEAFIEKWDAVDPTEEFSYPFEDACNILVQMGTPSHFTDPTPKLAPLNPWEYVLTHIAGYFCWAGLSDWDTASMEERRRQGEQVAKYARALAEWMETPPHPNYPSVYAFFDEEEAANVVKVCRMVSSDSTRSAVLRAEGGSSARDELVSILHANFGDLSSRDPHLYLQQLPPILRRLAKFAEDRINDDPPEKRPLTNGTERAFTRQLTTRFRADFHFSPDEVFAACVELRFPDYRPPPNFTETIRRWRGAK